jgi:diguanylate cyclase (GGDEF)-like protein
VVTRGRGDDFAIVLPNTSRPGAVAYAERIKTSSESHPFEHGRMTASLGVPALPESVTIAEELIGGAYQSVSDAKRSGGNRVAVL